MADRMFGVETEYALTAFRAGVPGQRAEVVPRLVSLAGPELRGLPGLVSGGFYLPNGGRFYIDHGMHPEYATPECVDPWDMVRHIEAGDRLISRLAQKLEQMTHALDVQIFKSNVDYSAPLCTWGCHESYQHRAAVGMLRRHIVPHLVSRVVFTGAGGFSPSGQGLTFTLSPRAACLCRVSSHDSTSNRGIVHLKEEPLSARGYGRLHVICGESLRSERASWLKMGTTALVVALIEAGIHVGPEYEPASPLDALRAFAGDSACSVKVPMASGHARTAVDIQRAHLRLAETHLDDPTMPPWAHDVCREWRSMLDRLEQGPAAVDRMLDWPLKLRLFQAHAAKAGFDWSTLRSWNDIVARVDDRQAEEALAWEPPATAVTETPNRSSALRAIEAAARSRGLDWDVFPRFQRLRQELFELDARFAEVGDDTLFADLDRRALLDHRIVSGIDRATTEPPGAGRASVRGRAIRRLTRLKDTEPGRYRAEWWGLFDTQLSEALDLTDPFTHEERWQKVEPLSRVETPDGLWAAFRGEPSPDAPGAATLLDEFS